MKRLFLRLTLVMVIASLALFSMSAQALASGGKKFEINFSSEYWPKHPTIVNGYLPMFEEMKKKTGGRLAIQYYAPKVLTPNREHFVATANGVVDMAFAPQGFTVGKMPLAKLSSLPLMFDSSVAGSLTVWELYKRFPEWKAEYDGIKTLWHHVSALFELHTVKKTVRTLEDLKGMKIIVWLPMVRNLATALGANPVEVNPHDTYLSLQRGMAEGVICPIAPMRSMKITEVTKHHTLLGLAVDSFWGGMNIPKFNSMPADLKKVFMGYMGDHIARVSGKTLDDGAARDTKWMKNNGHTIYPLPAAEKKRWLAKVRHMHEGYVKEMEGKGYKNARKIYDTAVQLSAEFQK